MYRGCSVSLFNEVKHAAVFTPKSKQWKCYNTHILHC